MSRNGATTSGNRGAISGNRLTIPTNLLTIPENGAAIPRNGATILKQHATIPRNGATILKQHATIPRNSAAISKLDLATSFSPKRLSVSPCLCGEFFDAAIQIRAISLLSANLTLISVETPASCWVTPYKTSAACMVPLLCVITMNCVVGVNSRSKSVNLPTFD